MKDIETINLMPDPSTTEKDGGSLNVVLCRDGSILMVKHPEGTSFQMTRVEAKRLASAIELALSEPIQHAATQD